MDVNDVFSARRCVRQFSDKPVERAVLERILRAAGQAPSARNEQPWEFYVATGPTRTELGRVVAQTTVYLREYVDALTPEGYDRAYAWYSSLGDAPVLVAVTMPESDDEFTAANRMLSVGTSLENLLLAATAEGLGACPFTFSFWVKAEIASVLDLPEGRTVACMVAIGWPDSHEEVVRQSKRADVAVWLD